MNNTYRFCMFSDGRRVRNLVPRQQLHSDIHSLVHNHLNPRFANCDVTTVPILNSAMELGVSINHHFNEPASNMVMPVQVEACGIGRTPSEVRINQSMIRPEQIQGRHVLILDVIMISGTTARTLRDLIAVLRPASITFVCLARLDFPEPVIEPDYCLYQFESTVQPVGFGLDYMGKYRGTPYLADINLENYPNDL